MREGSVPGLALTALLMGGPSMAGFGDEGWLLLLAASLWMRLPMLGKLGDVA